MKQYVSLGELMLRLKTPGHERFFQSPNFEATFGGGEANVAVALAHMGMPARFVTALPENPIADAAIRLLRGFGVDTSCIIRRGQRMGLYYLEAGANQRSSRVIYDRAGSAIAESGPADFDWDAVFEDAGWFHITGITPALSQSAADLAIAAAQAARERDVTVSCDINYRNKLWKYGKSPVEVMPELMESVDVGIAGAEDCQKALGISVEGHEPTRKHDHRMYEALTELMLERFANMSVIAITLRESRSADRHRWSACMRDETGFRLSHRYKITDIIDRVGGGDSFAAGLIYALNAYDDPQTVIEFAVPASCLKHSIPGDFNRVTVKEVERMLGGDKTGRVRR
ncbi:MAG: sugar kinase [Xanthomonadales bacterium]|nr:sugar kinase [Xanthomonadales bacterium]